ncbi:MAG: NACHT domain-containing protein, partial [Anaerolineales bacterium]|nr:NACHT domain-containing protein [Anaerolineales bacterium]
MARPELSDQQRQTAFQRLLSILPSASAHLVMYGAAAGAVYSLYPNDPAGLIAASPILANLVATIGGDLLASMIEKVASKDEPSPEEIIELLEQALANTQLATAPIQNLPTRRELYRAISLLDEKQDDRLLQLTQQNKALRALLEQVLDELRRLQKIELDNQPTIDEQASLETYLNWVQVQYNAMRVLSMTRPVPLDEMYTDVYVLDKPSYWRCDETEALQTEFISRSQFRSEKRQPGIDVLAEANRLFIVGKPGAGKTTFLRYLALQAARKQLPFAKIPVYVELKRLASSPGSLFDLLVKEFGLSGFPQAQGHVEQLLRQGNGLVLLDGLDEVVAEKRVAVHDQIDELVKLCGDSHVIITCRPHAEKHRLERFAYVEVADFTPDQVERFVGNWFGTDKTTSQNLLRDLAKQEHKNIRELARTPLLLALLCIAYAEAGAFPQRRDQLYSQAVQVMMEQWDEERGVRRDSV